MGLGVESFGIGLKVLGFWWRIFCLGLWVRVRVGAGFEAGVGAGVRVGFNVGLRVGVWVAVA